MGDLHAENEQGTRRNLYAFGLTSFFNDTASETGERDRRRSMEGVRGTGAVLRLIWDGARFSPASAVGAKGYSVTGLERRPGSSEIL